jgi:phosphoribosyl-ATP pyrophosphohydrolase
MTDVIDQLYATILARKAEGDPGSSYVATLFAKGRGTIARKVGEEAIETVIASLAHDADAVAAESADLLFHLAVLWADCGVTPGQVMDVLKAREGLSGLDEKAGRMDREVQS